MLDRMIRAARLDRALYEEVEANSGLTKEALLIVLLGAVASGLSFALAHGWDTFFLPVFLLAVILTLIGWVTYAGLAYLVGTRLLPEAGTRSSWKELLRTVGYAQAPRTLLVFGFLPVVGLLVTLVVGLWSLATTVVAVRQALDYESTWRAVAVAAIAWIAQALFLGLLSL